MDTNVQALKGLYAALNGDPKDVENMATSSEVITAMQDVAAAAATELPVVKKVDEGKVLTVNGNGKWSAALPESPIDDTEASETKTYSSSKIESLIPAVKVITGTIADNTFTISNDSAIKKVADVITAISSGAIVYVLATDGTSYKRFDATVVSGNFVYFTCMQRIVTSETDKTYYYSMTAQKSAPVSQVTNLTVSTLVVDNAATT